jgi:hypothetical protein
MSRRLPPRVRDLRAWFRSLWVVPGGTAFAAAPRSGRLYVDRSRPAARCGSDPGDSPPLKPADSLRLFRALSGSDVIVVQRDPAGLSAMRSPE